MKEASDLLVKNLKVANEFKICEWVVSESKNKIAGPVRYSLQATVFTPDPKRFQIACCFFPCFSASAQGSLLVFSTYEETELSENTAIAVCLKCGS